MKLTRRKLLLLAACGVGAAGAVAVSPLLAAELQADRRRREIDEDARPLFGGYRYIRASRPARTLVYDASGGHVATLTDGARAIVFTGPPRTFTEPTSTPARVESTSWVLLGPVAWTSNLAADRSYQAWFTTTVGQVKSGTVGDRDALTVAMEYIAGAPVRTDRAGIRYAGDAGFGPLVNGQRDNQADYYDYLGIPAEWADGSVSKPDPALRGFVDCSGLMRLIWGYRLGLLLTRGAAVPNVEALPRFARQLAVYPAAVTVFDSVTKPPTDTDLARLQPGDLVFLAQTADPRYISHCGMVVGVDSGGHLRFISSRAVVNGPSFGDISKVAVLDGGGYYAHRLRKAIRL